MTTNYNNYDTTKPKIDILIGGVFMFLEVRKIVKIVLVLFFILSLIGNYNIAVAVEETDGCEKAFNNCMEREGNLLNQVIPGYGYLYCGLGYLWCVTYVE